MATLKQNVEANVFSPELNKWTKITLLYGSNLEEILYSVLDSIQMPYPPENLEMFALSPDGWCRKLVSFKVSTSTETSILELRNKVSLEIRQKDDQPFVPCGAKYLLKSLVTSTFTSPKILSLSPSYKGYRVIRQDRDSFYRAFIFSVLEQIVSHQNRFALCSLKQLFSTLEFTDSFMSDSHQSMLMVLDGACSGVQWSSTGELFASVLTQESGIDEALVRACRMVVADNMLRDPFRVVSVRNPQVVGARTRGLNNNNNRSHHRSNTDSNNVAMSVEECVRARHGM